MKKKISKELLKICHENCKSQDKVMLTGKLAPLSVLNKAKRVHCEVTKEEKWLAAQHTTNFKALKSDCGGSSHFMQVLNALQQILDVSSSNMKDNKTR